MDPLKLIALDQDDIEIVSTHLQDAVVKVSDVIWLPREKRLVLGVAVLEDIVLWLALAVATAGETQNVQWSINCWRFS